MQKQNYQSRLENFTVLRNKFDKYIFAHGPMLLVVLFFITILTFLLASKNPFGQRNTLRWVEAVFFLFGIIVLFVEVYVTRSFFEKIPRTFHELVKRKVIKGLRKNSPVAIKMDSFLEEFENKLNNRMPLILSCFLEIMILVGSQRAYLFPIFFLPESFPISALIINFLTLFIPMSIAGYAMCVTSWKCYITGRFVHKFSSVFELSVSPNHPDKAGGLKPLGDLIFSLALILVVASIALSILTIANPINGAIYKTLVNIFSAKYQIVEPYYLYTTVLTAKVSLGFVLIMGIAAFLLPLTSAHKRMRNERIISLSSINNISIRIAELEKKSKNLSIDYTTRDNIFNEIASLSKIYDQTYKSPVWPFDRDILVKLFTPQVISLLSLLGVVQPIIDAVTSWMK